MRRREFITLLGGAAAAWPRAARAQQGDRIRRIGVLMSQLTNDPEGQARVAAFAAGAAGTGLDRSGATCGSTTRWSGGRFRRAFAQHAAELVALAPDVVLANGTSAVVALQQATRTVPIVFAQVTDPVGAGFVESLAQPGGNATGFTLFEYSTSGKWLELLKQIAPAVTRAAVLRDPAIVSRTRPIRRDPVGGAVARGGVAPGRHSRCRRDRARHHGIRACAERQPDRDVGRVHVRPSRVDHRARGPAPAACGLPLSLPGRLPAA